MARVVRPGGRVVILEITTPARLRRFYDLWFDRVVPQLGRLLGRDGAAYSYLPASVRRFPEPPALAARMAAAGLDGRPLAGPGGRHRRPPPRAGGVTSTAPRPSRPHPMTPLLGLCEQRLRDAVAGHAEQVARPAVDTLAAGGKRVRPLLVFCAAPPSALADPAAAREPALGRVRPSSWCTWPPWCTTTCWTAPPCAAAGRRWPSRSAPSGP